MAGMEVIDLVLTINKADGLAAKDSNMFGVKTKSDPYIELRLIPQGAATEDEVVDKKDKIFLGKTETKLKTLSPKWDQSFHISVPRKDCNEFSIFELTIMDKDITSSDDLMGVVPVHVPVGRWGTFTKWYGVPASSAGGEEATGRVQCTMSVEHSHKTPDQIKAANEATEAGMGNNDKSRELPELAGGKVEVINLKLTVKRAAGLAAMDKNIIGMKTKSDPYIEVRLCPKGPGGGPQSKVLLGKTETKMETLNPSYNQVFEAPPLSLKSFGDTASFELTIMDYDENGEDDLMGMVTVPIKLDKSGSSTKWYDVPKDSGEGGKASGKVQCMLSVSKDIQSSACTADTEVKLKAALAGKSKPMGPPPPRTSVTKRTSIRTSDSTTKTAIQESLRRNPVVAPMPKPPTRVAEPRARSSSLPQQPAVAGEPVLCRESEHGPALQRSSTAPVSSSKCQFCEKGNHSKKDCPEWLEFQAFKKQKEKERQEEEERRRQKVLSVKDRLAKRTSSMGSGERQAPKRQSSLRVRRSSSSVEDDDLRRSSHSSRKTPSQKGSIRVSSESSRRSSKDGERGVKRASSMRLKRKSSMEGSSKSSDKGGERRSNGVKRTNSMKRSSHGEEKKEGRIKRTASRGEGGEKKEVDRRIRRTSSFDDAGDAKEREPRVKRKNCGKKSLTGERTSSTSSRKHKQRPEGTKHSPPPSPSKEEKEKNDPSNSPSETKSSPPDVVSESESCSSEELENEATIKW